MRVVEIFNKMAPNYDEIHDLWYAWLFSRLHYIIATRVIQAYNPTTVLDVGCGTGFQSFLHASFGASVVGIDIARDLIEVAQKKAAIFNPQHDLTLFTPHFDFVKRYNEIIETVFQQITSARNYTPPVFQVGDARCLPFPSSTFDHINCCGSTLSFIRSPHRAIFEIARVLKPGGTLFLEFESRWNLDLFWAALDVLLNGKFGYEISSNQSLKAIFTSAWDDILINYPFDDYKDQTRVFMKLRVFNRKRLESTLSVLQLPVIKRWSIHSITNLIPSKCLGVNSPPKGIRRLFTVLARIEERLPIAPPGSSLVFLAQKTKKRS